jgi:hypothetical protein
MTQIRVMHERRKGCLPTAEARLLRQINKGFDDSWWQRYHDLIEKRRKSILKAAEHRELIGMTDEVERREAKRLQALVKLAKLRKQSLTDVMMDLGLPGKTDA